MFDFSFYTSGKTEEQDIINDDSLLNAINEAFQGPDESNLMIKILIKERLYGAQLL